MHAGSVVPLHHSEGALIPELGLNTRDSISPSAAKSRGKYDGELGHRPQPHSVMHHSSESLYGPHHGWAESAGTVVPALHVELAYVADALVCAMGYERAPQLASLSSHRFPVKLGWHTQVSSTRLQWPCPLQAC